MDAWSKAQVKFWSDIYSRYSSQEMVVHDSRNLVHVYGIVQKSSEVKPLIQKIRARLKDIHEKLKTKTGAPEFTEDEIALIEVMEKSYDPDLYMFAAHPDRFRVQLGVKDHIVSGALLAEKYLNRMKEILKEEGVPEVLSLLPFVESSFNLEANSKVGAAGIWQFMPKTAMKDLRVDRLIDERRDPLKATRAAARFLKANEKKLGDWALAIMAYHSGPGLVARAIDQVKSKNPLHLIRIYKGPEFKFASRNYLFEFLAMCEKQFSSPHSIPNFITVSFPHPLKVKSLIAHYHLKEETIRELNPQFLDPILKSLSPIPSHYPIRMSGITLEEFRKLEYPKSQ